MITAIALASLSIAANFQSPDLDSDGLPDVWETAGSGPIRPGVHGCKPDHADFFFVAVRRPGVTMASVRSNLDRAKRFFASLPNRNPDGTTGINMIVVDGGELPASEASTPYDRLFATRMPADWKGKGHGYVLENSDGLNGGNTVNGAWSASAYHWSIIVHELGHQFGLGHQAPDSRPGPIYTSLMNYNYSYGFRGSIENIHYSTGKFLTTPLDETSLNEVMPFPMDALSHFSEGPYDLKLRRRSATETEVDFNRNGLFGERNVRATVSDGYGVITGEAIHLGPVSGAPTIAVVRDVAYVIWPTKSSDRTAWTTTYSNEGQSLRYIRKSGRAVMAESTLLPGALVKGSPSAAEFKDRLAVGYLTGTRYPVVSVWATAGAVPGRRVLAISPIGTVADSISLVSSQSTIRPSLDQCWALTWNKDTKKTTVYEILETGSETSPIARFGEGKELDLRSETPVAGVYNRKTSRLVVVGTATRGTATNCLQITDYKFVEGTGWMRTAQSWVGLASDGAVTGVAPCVLLDDTETGGTKGQLRIFFRPRTELDAASTIFRALQIDDTSYHGGWRIRMMRDEWSASRSAASAADYKGETLFAMRWFGGELDNRLVFMDKASGISSTPIRDFDDVTHVATRGLKVSLEAFRR